ncbi:tyrosine decarboxylase 1 isoform X2 [Cucumis melo var. makuwa]|uniref:Tyrosine decarboxylase 1 isoform X2 n=1 Tax=Cucumis melo var. makuwa TaxID=1194695 RepID=A0A5A7T8Z8_CUCMM|nr:tyrosine decarboxylase 1 isoform X2 [Cucumis melo var. makuwa]TYK19021.1 tyrosine decarboxylase 1 isoform X2 [Cucumis melo var. makuwa]
MVVATVATSGLVWVSPRLFSSVLLLFVSDTILKAINTMTKLMWKLEYWEQNDDIDRHALIRSLSTNPEYLKNKASEAELVVDYKDWQIPLGRRFRSLKVWLVLRLYGTENLQKYIRNHISIASFTPLASKNSHDIL